MKNESGKHWVFILTLVGIAAAVNAMQAVQYAKSRPVIPPTVTIAAPPPSAPAPIVEAAPAPIEQPAPVVIENPAPPIVVTEERQFIPPPVQREKVIVVHEPAPMPKVISQENNAPKKAAAIPAPVVVAKHDEAPPVVQEAKVQRPQPIELPPPKPRDTTNAAPARIHVPKQNQQPVLSAIADNAKNNRPQHQPKKKQN